jgi:hypothetical protein
MWKITKASGGKVRSVAAYFINRETLGNHRPILVTIVMILNRQAVVVEVFLHIDVPKVESITDGLLDRNKEKVSPITNDITLETIIIYCMT